MPGRLKAEKELLTISLFQCPDTVWTGIAGTVTASVMDIQEVFLLFLRQVGIRGDSLRCVMVLVLEPIHRKPIVQRWIL